MIEECLQQFLAARPSLLYLAGRVFPQRLPQDAGRPALTYSRASTVRPKALDGTGLLVRSRMRLGNWGGGTSPYADAKKLAGLVLIELRDSFVGAIAYKDAGGNPQTMTVSRAWIENEWDEPGDPAAWAADQVDECVTQDWIIWHYE